MKLQRKPQRRWLKEATSSERPSLTENDKDKWNNRTEMGRRQNEGS